MNKFKRWSTTFYKIWFLYLCKRHVNLVFKFRNKSNQNCVQQNHLNYFCF